MMMLLLTHSLNILKHLSDIRRDRVPFFGKTFQPLTHGVLKPSIRNVTHKTTNAWTNPLTADWKSDDRCSACRRVKWSQCRAIRVGHQAQWPYTTFSPFCYIISPSLLNE